MSHTGARLGEAALSYAARGDEGTVQLLSFTREAGDIALPRGGVLGMGVKLIVQIPCLNEEETLPATLATIPRHIPGIEVVEILVIDDGSTDATVEVARRHGVHHVVRHVGNKGLAEAFQSGIDACLKLGADIIVNTDGDNQYPQEVIPDLIAPILAHRADIVIADRQTDTIEHFSGSKKVLQKFGSWVVRKGSGTNVPDAPSGFRAYSREAALRLNVVTKHSYTLETIIQAGKKNLIIDTIQVRTNLVTRPSRLMRGTFDYIKKQGATIVRIYAMYEPLKFFFLFGAAIFLIGLAVLARVLVLKLLGGTLAAYIPAIVAGGVLMTIGVLIVLIGLVADLIASVRRLLEDTLYRVKKMELQMERERGEREQLLASILNFDQDGQDGQDGLDGSDGPNGHDLPRDRPIAADRALDSITSLASVRSRRDSPPDRPTR